MSTSEDEDEEQEVEGPALAPEPISLPDMNYLENTSDSDQRELVDNPVMKSQNEKLEASEETWDEDATDIEDETEEEASFTNNMVPENKPLMGKMLLNLKKTTCLVFNALHVPRISTSGLYSTKSIKNVVRH